MKATLTCPHHGAPPNLLASPLLTCSRICASANCIPDPGTSMQQPVPLSQPIQVLPILLPEWSALVGCTSQFPQTASHPEVRGCLCLWIVSFTRAATLTVFPCLSSLYLKQCFVGNVKTNQHSWIKKKQRKNGRRQVRIGRCPDRVLAELRAVPWVPCRRENQGEAYGDSEGWDCGFWEGCGWRSVLTLESQLRSWPQAIDLQRAWWSPGAAGHRGAEPSEDCADMGLRRSSHPAPGPLFKWRVSCP